MGAQSSLKQLSLTILIKIFEELELAFLNIFTYFMGVLNAKVLPEVAFPYNM